jgi:hypothetical protein
MSYGTFTRSETNTYTEARARYVMGKVHEDLIGLTTRGLITIDRANGIKESVLYLLNKQALRYFQLQFKTSSGAEIGGLHYQLTSDGDVVADDSSGQIDYWMLANDTKVSLLVDIDQESSNIGDVNQQLEDWGWGTGGALSGTKQHLKSYSKDGYGLNQSKIGSW